jgi:hypothetical protein
MYAITCFTYQVDLYDSEAITYLIAKFWTSTMSHQIPPTPKLQAALPPSVWQHNLTYLEENSSMVKLPYLC